MTLNKWLGTGDLFILSIDYFTCTLQEENDLTWNWTVAADRFDSEYELGKGNAINRSAALDHIRMTMQSIKTSLESAIHNENVFEGEPGFDDGGAEKDDFGLGELSDRLTERPWSEGPEPNIEVDEISKVAVLKHPEPIHEFSANPWGWLTTKAVAAGMALGEGSGVVYNSSTVTDAIRRYDVRNLKNSFRVFSAKTSGMGVMQWNSEVVPYLVSCRERDRKGKTA